MRIMCLVSKYAWRSSCKCMGEGKEYTMVTSREAGERNNLTADYISWRTVIAINNTEYELEKETGVF